MDQDLRERVAQEIHIEMERATKNPVRWGEDDCLMFALNPIWRATGVDPARSIRGRYHSREEAMALAGPKGIAYALMRAARIVGLTRIDPVNSRPADLGITTFNVGENQRALVSVICLAPGWFVARSIDGFTALRHDLVRMAWSVA